MIEYGPDDTIVLYRPAGPEEMALVEESGFRAWPPRLPEQPIFYPVTNEQYAQEITEQWNVRQNGGGYVTRFLVRKEFMERYEVQIVGGRRHEEWWVPAEDLGELNENIVGKIEVISEFNVSA